MTFLKSSLTIQHSPITLVLSTPEAFHCCLRLLHTQQSEHLPRASQHERPKLCLAVAPSIQSLCCTQASQSSLALSARKLPLLTTLLCCPSLLMPSLGKHFCHLPSFSPPQCKPSCSGYFIALHPKESICLSRKLLPN